jgi:meiotic recombination protein SPO11
MTLFKSCSRRALCSNLTTPDIKWLGVRPSDLDRFNIPEQCRLDMTDEDLKTGRKLVRAHLLHADCSAG